MRHLLFLLMAILVPFYVNGQSEEKIEVKKYNFKTIRDYRFIPKTKIVLVLDRNGNVFRSANGGLAWAPIKTANKVTDIVLHDYKPERFYLVSNGKSSMVATDDYGATFYTITLPLPPVSFLSFDGWVFVFHPDFPNQVMFAGEKGCPGGSCHAEHFVTTDHGKNWRFMVKYATQCDFAKDNKFFKVPDNLTYCEVFQKQQGDQSTAWSAKSNLMKSTDVFNTNKEVWMSDITGYFIYDNYLALGKVEDESDGKDLHVYFSSDGMNLALAQFPPNKDIDSFIITVLESTAENLLINLMDPNSMRTQNRGNIWVSNNNLTFYSMSLENSNQEYWNVDFQPFNGLEGIYLANALVPPFNDLTKEIQSRISFDNGISWIRVRAPRQDSQGNAYDCSYNFDSSCSLQLHGSSSYSGYDSIGGVATAPGIMAAVGNVGSTLGEIRYASTFLTTNAGASWFEVARTKKIIEYSDQGALLLMADDQVPTTYIQYSYDFGTTWHQYTFSKSEKYSIFMVDNAPDSNYRVFLLITLNSKNEVEIITIDFSNIFSRQCVLNEANSDNSDFELWTPTPETSSYCTSGHRSYFWRKKASAKCYVGKDYEIPKAKSVNCDCTERDYDCDAAFWRDPNGRCSNYLSSLPIPPKDCQSGSTYKYSSGYIKFKDSTCAKDLSITDPIELPCRDPVTLVSQSQIPEPKTIIRLQGTTTTLLISAEDGGIYKTQNDGEQWMKIDEVKESSIPIVDTNFPDRVFFLSKTVGASIMESDKSSRLDKCPCNVISSKDPGLYTHPLERSYLLCHESQGQANKAFYSKNGGSSWEPLASGVTRCYWGSSKLFKGVDNSAIYCIMYEMQSVVLVQNFNYGSAQTLVSGGVTKFTISGQFIFITTMVDGIPKLHVSEDGLKVSRAFYTALSPDPNQIVTFVNRGIGRVLIAVHNEDSMFGDLYTSDAHGNFFSLSLRNIAITRIAESIINTGNNTYKAAIRRFGNLDGFYVANCLSEMIIIDDKERAYDDGPSLQSWVSFDDGANWMRIRVNNHLCQGFEPCNLNIHLDPYTTGDFSVISRPFSNVPGLIVAQGNVGENLGQQKHAHTFVTTDGGWHWYRVQSGPYHYAIGDSGTVVVLADADDYTETFFYSFNGGSTFFKAKIFTDGQQILAESVVSDGTGKSLVFTIYGINRVGRFISVRLDMSNLYGRKCDLANEDLEYWNPYPWFCIGGQKIEYKRRKTGKFCSIGNTELDIKYTIANCPCTVRDYECDFTFIRNATGQCQLSPMEKFPDMDARCNDGSWTGYRKIPGSKCQGGVQLQGLDSRDCIKYLEDGGISIDGKSGGLVAGSVVFALLLVAGVGLGGIYYKRAPRIRLPSIFSRGNYSIIGNGDSAGPIRLGNDSSNQLNTFDDEPSDSAALTPKQTLI